jgi:hypothetical protein
VKYKDSPVRDPKRFGRELAERMVSGIKTNKVSPRDALRKVSSDVAGRAKSMVADGRRRDEVAKWVGDVQAAWLEGLHDHLRAADPVEMD